MDKAAIKKIANNLGRAFRRKAEKFARLSKKLKPGAVFKTGTGKISKVERVDTHYLYIKTSKNNVVRIPIANVKKMLAYFFQIRIVERKELEVFHSYNSIMMGLLMTLFEGKSKICRIGKLLRLLMIGIRVYLAGGEKCPTDLAMAAHAGAKYVLFSYYWIRNGKAWQRYLKENGLKMILDSGAFSAWIAEQKGKNAEPIDIGQYMEFIEAHQELIQHYFVLDVIGNAKKTAENLQIMEQRGLTPIPVFHKGSDIAELDKLVNDGYPVIGIGGCVNQKGVRKFLCEIFLRYPKQAFHGLGISKAEIILNYPFFTCDSTAWLNCRREDKGVVLTAGGQVKMHHMSVLDRVKKSIGFLINLEKPKTFKSTTFIGEQLSFFRGFSIWL